MAQKKEYNLTPGEDTEKREQLINMSQVEYYCRGIEGESDRKREKGDISFGV